MELRVSTSRENGKLSKGGFFIISITEGAKVSQGTFETTMLRHVIELARTS